MVPFRGFYKSTSQNPRREAIQDRVHQGRVHSTTPILGKNVKVEKVDVFCSKMEIVGFDGFALKSPAVAGEPLVESYQP